MGINYERLIVILCSVLTVDSNKTGQIYIATAFKHREKIAQGYSR